MHKFTLQPYAGPASRFDCPQCGTKKRFTRYIDTENNTYIDPKVGKCDRENNCGYHLKPAEFFKHNQQGNPLPVAVLADKNKEPDFMSLDVMKESFRHYGSNNFVQFLMTNFNKEKVIDAIDEYLIGTSNHWPCSTIFWQVDIENRVRSGKIMLYSFPGGKRVKEPFPHITWIHKTPFFKATNPRFHLKQCLFGEHLLNKYPGKRVGVVESEKTAIICSIVYPEYVWLSCGSLNAINIGLFAPLMHRKVVLFPDLMGKEKWEERASKLPFKVRVSDFLEVRMLGHEKKQGLDLADYVLLTLKGEKREDRTPIELIQKIQSHI